MIPPHPHPVKPIHPRKSIFLLMLSRPTAPADSNPCRPPSIRSRRPEGWSICGGNENHRTARYVEFSNSGPGARAAKHPDWVKQLTPAEAEEYTIADILGGKDHWNTRQH
jgi:hypothetical protein